MSVKNSWASFHSYSVSYVSGIYSINATGSKGYLLETILRSEYFCKKLLASESIYFYSLFLKGVYAIGVDGPSQVPFPTPILNLVPSVYCIKVSRDCNNSSPAQRAIMKSSSVYSMSSSDMNMFQHSSVRWFNILCI